jgi:drug/metabolite transporter (DMT)-like permease
VLIAVACALGSSLLYAMASVLQHQAAVAQPQSESMRLGLLTRLVRNPWWLIGIASDGLAFALQFIALGHGALVLVQPLLVCGLLFALPLGAWLSGWKMGARDWGGALLVVAGLSGFLAAASPGKGYSEVSGASWTVLIVLASAAMGALIMAAQRRPGRARAGLLAAAAGINYGLTAALTKACAHLLGISVVRLLSGWEVYGLVIFGVLGMLLAQSAFQADSLDASLPVLTVVDPVVSIIIGAVVLGEGIKIGLIATPLEIVGLGLMVVGVFMLSRAEAEHAAVKDTVGP